MVGMGFASLGLYRACASSVLTAVHGDGVVITTSVQRKLALRCAGDLLLSKGALLALLRPCLLCKSAWRKSSIDLRVSSDSGDLP